MTDCLVEKNGNGKRSTRISGKSEPGRTDIRRSFGKEKSVGY
jgi:hypothetical protein